MHKNRGNLFATFSIILNIIGWYLFYTAFSKADIKTGYIEKNVLISQIIALVSMFTMYFTKNKRFYIVGGILNILLILGLPLLWILGTMFLGP
mgnify:CR=1 FL=1